ncbi:MAG TPA: hypothetical protein PLD44_03355, partial [Paludibacteraceae bacterium]|nr:hypothetical protein [Paludibacteraceae bacterium]
CAPKQRNFSYCCKNKHNVIDFKTIIKTFWNKYFVAIPVVFLLFHANLHKKNDFYRLLTKNKGRIVQWKIIVPLEIMVNMYIRIKFLTVT